MTWAFPVILLVLAAAVLFVGAPLWRGRAVSARASTEVADLQAAREAKYREIRDAELDYRTGKLSEQDYRELDWGLRAEAIEILRRLDTAPGADSGPARG